MASKLSLLSPLRKNAVRAFSAQVAPKAKPSRPEALPKQDIVTTKLPNGLVVTSLENYSPVARIAIVVKGGARYEDSSNLGITHALRNAAGLTTENSTTFGITKNLEHLGANLTASTTRDHLVYGLECNRDDAAKALKYATDVVFFPAFKPWEVSDTANHVKIDLAIFRQNQEAVLMEALHQAAFRGGLANSLFLQDFLVGKHSHKKLAEYVKTHVTAPRAVVSCVGLENDRLVHVLKNLKLRDAPGAELTPSKFAAGEARVEYGSNYTTVALAVEGASVTNQKEWLASAVLQQLLGCGLPTKYSQGESTKLGQAAAKVATQPFAVHCLNLNYSDTGLFGVTIAGHHDEMDKLTKAVLSQVVSVTKSVSDKDVQQAKHKLKSAWLQRREDHTKLALDFALETSYLGDPLSSAELEGAIDSLTTQDVAVVAAKVSKGKPAVAAVGRLHKTLRVDELV
ncbi:cytochrome b-c1 complex subunit 2, mitochondrial-like [Ornithodoros turicata]|uniref:cytochrome b-c1 complex subunit 2, mitochondrial-like n=1 Tax=Ornithodoros turicata TaxID=34597 RepID=UPI0031396E92